MKKLKGECDAPMQVPRLIFGLGTGRCGTATFAAILARLGVAVTHEARPLLPWKVDLSRLDWVLCRLANKKRTMVADVGSYYLPYVETILARFPQAKFICLKREKEATVESFDIKTGPRNHWTKDRRYCVEDRIWDPCFPKYKVRDKREAIRRYWDEYYAEAERLERAYPESFRIVSLTELASIECLEKLFSFLGLSAGREQLAEFSCVHVNLRKPIPSKKNRLKALLRPVWHMPGKVRRVVRRTCYRLGPVPECCFRIVIPVRNRTDVRFRNTLISLAKQEFPGDSMAITVVDQGSSVEQFAKLKTWQKEFGFDLWKCKNPGAEWSKVRAMNAGAAASGEPLLLFSDADIIYAPNYLAECARYLREDPVSVILCECREILPDVVDFNLFEPRLFDAWLRRSFLRAEVRKSEPIAAPVLFGWGIVALTRRLFEDVGGYDERFTGYGHEDRDLVERLRRFGARLVDISATTAYLHQAHERFHGLSETEIRRFYDTNSRFLCGGPRLRFDRERTYRDYEHIGKV